MFGVSRGRNEAGDGGGHAMSASSSAVRSSPSTRRASVRSDSMRLTPPVICRLDALLSTTRTTPTPRPGAAPRGRTWPEGTDQLREQA